MAHVTTVLMVNWAGSYGGAEKYQLVAVNGFDRQRYRFVFASPPGEWRKRVTDAGYYHVEVPARPGLDLQTVRRLHQVIKEEKVDLVHAAQSRVLLQAGLAARLAGNVPVVQTEWNMSMGWHKGRVYPWYVPVINHRLRRLIVHVLANRIIAPGRSIRDFYTQIIGTPAEKVVIIHGACPLPPERPRPVNPHPVIGTLAELHERKGLPSLIAAAPIVLQKYPNAEFRIMGRGHLQRMLEEMITQNGLQNSVKLLGFVPNASERMPEWDMLVLPSQWDPFPLTILEGMSYGLPVVTTAIDGALDMMVDGETGLLVPPGDPQALAAAILRLLDDPAAAQEMGRRGRERVAQVFSIERVVRQLDELYQDLLRGRR